MRDGIDLYTGTLFATPYQIVRALTVPGKDSLPPGRTAHRLTTAMLSVAVAMVPPPADEGALEFDCRAVSAFFTGAARIVRSAHGSVRGLTGDSLLAIFDPTHEAPADLAVWTALNLAFFAKEVIPSQLPASARSRILGAGLGVTYGEILIARAPIPGENHAPLLCISEAVKRASAFSRRAFPTACTIISEETYLRLRDMRTINAAGQACWEAVRVSLGSDAAILAYRTSSSLPFETGR